MAVEPTPLHTVLYDDECPLCVFQMRMLARLDWRHAFRLLPLSDEQSRAAGPGIPQEDLQEAMHCITADGKIHRGARCVRFVGMRLPLVAPWALLLWIPGVIFFAEMVYRAVSRNRLVLSRFVGCQGTCAITPAGKQE